MDPSIKIQNQKATTSVWEISSIYQQKSALSDY